MNVFVISLTILLKLFVIFFYESLVGDSVICLNRIYLWVIKFIYLIFF